MVSNAQIFDGMALHYKVYSLLHELTIEVLSFFLIMFEISLEIFFNMKTRRDRTKTRGAKLRLIFPLDFQRILLFNDTFNIHLHIHNYFESLYQV